MKLRIVLSLVATAILTAFLIVNWSALAAPAMLSLGFRTVEAPLGLVMLGLTMLVGLLFAAYATHLRQSALIQAGRNAEELQAQRQIAEQEESSRFTALRQDMEAGFKRLAEGDEHFRSEVQARLEAIEKHLQLVGEQPRPATVPGEQASLPPTSP